MLPLRTVGGSVLYHSLSELAASQALGRCSAWAGFSCGKGCYRQEWVNTTRLSVSYPGTCPRCTGPLNTEPTFLNSPWELLPFGCVHWESNKSRQCRDQRDKLIAVPSDFFVLAIIYLIERVASGIASSFASAKCLRGHRSGLPPRNPEESLLYQVVAGELETFLASQQARDHTIPKFVEDEFRSFLECWVLAHGCVHCKSCDHSPLGAR